MSERRGNNAKKTQVPKAMSVNVSPWANKRGTRGGKRKGAVRKKRFKDEKKVQKRGVAKRGGKSHTLSKHSNKGKKPKRKYVVGRASRTGELGKARKRSLLNEKRKQLKSSRKSPEKKHLGRKKRYNKSKRGLMEC